MRRLIADLSDITRVRSLVELRGGTVRREGGGLGHGSGFTVCLPLAANNCGASSPGVAPSFVRLRTDSWACRG